MFYIGPTVCATIAVLPITLCYYCINCFLCEEFTENSNYYLFIVGLFTAELKWVFIHNNFFSVESIKIDHILEINKLKFIKCKVNIIEPLPRASNKPLPRAPNKLNQVINFYFKIWYCEIEVSIYIHNPFYLIFPSVQW
jgi:hypothetical protein